MRNRRGGRRGERLSDNFLKLRSLLFCNKEEIIQFINQYRYNNQIAIAYQWLSSSPLPTQAS